MGCNCKGGKRQALNNLQSIDHINLATETYNNIILKRPIEEYSDLDKFEVFNTFRELYPNAKVIPSIENAVENVKYAVLNYTK